MHDRDKGTTDGTFRGHRYFQCADNAGLFVSLDQIRPTVQHPRGAALPTECSDPGKGRGNSSGKPSPGTEGKIYSGAVKGAPGSSVDPTPSNFKVGQRVMFFNKKGGIHYGVVRWTGRSARNRTFEYSVVGIECVG